MSTEQGWRERIVCDPQVHHGEPTIRGTRIAVSVLVGSLTTLSIEQLLEQYPQLTRQDIEASDPLRRGSRSEHAGGLMAIMKLDEDPLILHHFR